MNSKFQPVGEPEITLRRWRLSPIWLIPAFALLIGVFMLVQHSLEVGPQITITFQSATGLEPGKTAVKYKDVTVGIVNDIQLRDDNTQVLVTVRLNKSAERLARADSRFWVVRPRVGLGGVTGIDTILSGAYIGVDTGNSPQVQSHFTGLESPPTIVNNTPGAHFVIQTEDLGSLDIGSPVYYRRVQVGRVTAYHLSQDGRSVSVQIFIDAPYDHFVTPNSRFWNASGVDLSVGANGFRLRTQTVAAVMAGGIAFTTPETPDPQAQPDRAITYTLFKDQESATAPPDGPPIPFKLHFERSLHGLEIGAVVEFSSIKIGRVVSIDLDYSSTGYRFPSVVGIEVYPSRLGNVLNKLPKSKKDLEQATAEFTRDLVEQGLRAQAIPSNLLTGQLYISLDFIPNATHVPFNMKRSPLVLPTINGGFDRLQEQIASIVNKVDKMPLDAIAHHLNNTLAGMDVAFKQVNAQTLPATNQLLKRLDSTAINAQTLLAEDSPLLITVTQTLQEMLRAMRSVRNLADQLDTQPESLLRGRTSDPTLSDSPSLRSSPQGVTQ
jgi:paraquat-inducible protein B